MRLIRWTGFSVLVGAIVLVLVAPVWGAQGETVRISQSPDGQTVSGQSTGAAISADGRYVAFQSSAFELVADDTNGVWDVFVHDRETGTIDRVSVSSNGDQATFGDSSRPAISADGRYISFASGAPDLVADDPSGFDDIFIHDRQTGNTERISVASNGEAANDNSHASALSADGRFVAFESGASNLVAGGTGGGLNVFVHDLQTGQTRWVSVGISGDQPNGPSSVPEISADGRWVSFTSAASNLVADDDNGMVDVFVHDLQSGVTTLVSLDSNGSQGDGDSLESAMSPDGRYISFASRASNLVPDDTNGVSDIFVRDLQTGETTRVSVASDGEEGDGDSFDPAMSADTRFISFHSAASNLVADDTNGVSDIFVRDLQTAETRRISLASNGDQANGRSLRPMMSADGRYVAFDSLATNLASDDTNLTEDMFVHQYLPDPSAPPSTTTTTTSPPGDWFIDIADSTFRDDINTIAAAGITRGCDPPMNDRFCPNDPVTRGQMAAFLNRALGLDPAGDQGLVDMAGSVFVGDVDALYASRITRGCNPPVNDRFCPNDLLTRGQMAAFLNRALGLDPAGDQGLVDMAGSVFVGDVDALYASGIVRGCNPPVNDRFCPHDPVTRGQMAAFLRRALLP